MSKYPVSHIKNLKNNTRLSLVIPVRASLDRADVVERLQFVRMDQDMPSEIEVVIVDDGSAEKDAQDIQEACDRLCYGYIRLDTELYPISMGRARNAAAAHVCSKFILFQDLDLMPYNGFYRDVMREILVQNLDKCSDEFIMFGVIYLTPDATTEFIKLPLDLRRQSFIQALFNDDQSRIEKFSTGTSVCVYTRDYFLARGGFDEDFEEWGYEDLELNCRLLRRLKKFPFPYEYTLDYRTFKDVTEYRGWKASYRLMGDMTFMKGMVLFHAWHQVNRDGKYMKGAAENRKLFERKMHAYIKYGTEPLPLHDVNAGRTLLFRINPFVYNRDFLPKLGEVIQEDESRFEDADAFLCFIKEMGISRVLFFNPYANELIMKLYCACREYDIPYIVAERGALRDSVFFDPCGFNADSLSYSATNWDHELSDQERHEVINYIQEERKVSESLESQGNRIGRKALAEKLRLRPGKKILFVPFQRPGDTVIKYFAGSIGNFDNFASLVADVAKQLPKDWVVVTKKHPLEDNSLDIPGAIVADDANIKDLLDLADAVLLINSGVGVLAMMWEKPVMYAGEVFYGHDDLNKRVVTVDDVLECLASGFSPDRERMLRFIHFLVYRFYSFGRFTTREVRMEDDSRMTATTNIDFYVVRFPSSNELRLTTRIKPEVGWGSVLFDRYRGTKAALESEMNAKRNMVKDAFKGHIVAQANKIVDMNKSQSTVRKGYIRKKLRKLFKNPVMFLRDSRFKSLRKMGNVIAIR